MDQRLPWIIGLSVVVSAIAVWHSRMRRERRKRFDSREDLELDAIYHWFFAHRGLPRDLVLELWRAVAESLGLPAGQLRPSDRFDEELAFLSGWGFEDEAGKWVLAEMRRFERRGDWEACAFDEVQTVGDYIEYRCHVEMQNRGHDEHNCEKEQKSG